MSVAPETDVRHRHRDLLGLRWAVRIIACIEDPEVIEKILTHLDPQGAAAGTSRRPPCRAPRQTGLFD